MGDEKAVDATLLGCLTLLLADADGATPIAAILAAVVVIAICADFARILGLVLLARVGPPRRSAASR